LDAVLNDVRQVAKEEVAARKAALRAPSAPGVFAKPKPRRRPTNWRYSLLVIAGIALVIAAGIGAFLLIQRGIAESRMQDAMYRISNAMPGIESSMTQAQQFRTVKDYPAAAQAFRAVTERADVALQELDRVPVRRVSARLREQLEQMVSRIRGIRSAAQSALDSPEVKYGEQGFVEYSGQWVTPQERDRLFADKMRAEGRTEYNGEWLNEAEIHERKGERLYNDRWVSAQEYARLTGSAIEPPPAAPTPRPSAFDAAQATWIMDDFEGPRNDWTAVNWRNANPSRVSVVTKDGSRRLLVATQSGPNDKWAVMKRLTADFTSRSIISMDIYNDTGVPIHVAIALDTDQFYESRWKTVTMKLNRAVTFDLKSEDYKCQPTWTHFSPVKNLTNVRNLYILIYNNQPGDIYLDNIVALGGE